MLDDIVSDHSLTYCRKFSKRLHGNSDFCPKITDCTNICAAVARLRGAADRGLPSRCSRVSLTAATQAGQHLGPDEGVASSAPRHPPRRASYGAATTPVSPWQVDLSPITFHLDKPVRKVDRLLLKMPVRLGPMANRSPKAQTYNQAA